MPTIAKEIKVRLQSLAWRIFPDDKFKQEVQNLKPDQETTAEIMGQTFVGRIIRLLSLSAKLTPGIFGINSIKVELEVDLKLIQKER